jgi:L-2-hydroxyglutarate oxidase
LTTDIIIIGGGILGISISYFLSSSTNANVSVIEQHNVASHTSTRNTGKVHAPFLYNPNTRSNSARASFLGFDMLKRYCELKSLPFAQDGILEVATYDKGIDKLHEYMKWGFSNGLQENELVFLNKDEVTKLEPNVRCLAAIHCSRDASVNYRLITQQLAEDAKELGCKILTGKKVIGIEQKRDNNRTVLRVSEGKELSADYLINAAGGNAVDIAHGMAVAQDYTDLHFRGEYWEAPAEYHDLTRSSIYSVPRYPEYPFLDPHWILRVDGRREVGPNAVPVFGPYAYRWKENLASFFPKLRETIGSGAGKMWIDTQFISLALNELKSSLSKNAMIERVREFLPQIDPSQFRIRGTSGIRSSLVDRNGKFVPDTKILWQEGALHILNYNSPGSTGALPIAATLTNKMLKDGIVSGSAKPSSIWDIQFVSQSMASPSPP